MDNVPRSVQISMKRLSAISIGQLVLAAGITLSLVVLVAPRQLSHRTGPGRIHSVHNLRQIGFSLWAYHDRYGHLPPPYIADADGRAFFSWRVLLLPFVEETQLFRDFDLGKAWNENGNAALSEPVVDVYSCPESDGGPGKSPIANYLAVTGPGTAWRNDGPISLTDISSPSETILVIEVVDSDVRWSEPRDLSIAEAVHLLHSSRLGGANVMMADGSVRFVTSNDADMPGFEKMFEVTPTMRQSSSNRQSP